MSAQKFNPDDVLVNPETVPDGWYLVGSSMGDIALFLGATHARTAQTMYFENDQAADPGPDALPILWQPWDYMLPVEAPQ